MLRKTWGTCGLDGHVTLAVYGLSEFIKRSIVILTVQSSMTPNLI